MEEVTKINLSRKFLVVLFPALFIAANLFLFGPFSIYQGNETEFGISFFSIIKNYITPGLALVLGLLGIGIALPPGPHKRFTSILFALGILLWLQGNILVWDYGVIGKGAIDWTKDTWRGWTDAAIWVTILLLAIIFFKHVYTIAQSGSIAFVLLQMILFVYTGMNNPAVWKDKMQNSHPPEGIYEFSSKQNIIHIILDELQTDVFKKIIAQDTGHYRSVFEGFTMFQENTGSFPTTLMSIPAFLSGQSYKNDVTIQQFVDSIYRGKTIPNVLYDKGYEVDLAAEQDWYGLGRHTNWFYIPVPYGGVVEDYEKTNADFMMSLTIFRQVPHFVKQAIRQNQIQIPIVNLNATESYEAVRHLSHKAFLQDLIDHATVNRDKPVYKLIHLTTTHWPIVMNAQCEYAGHILPFTWENIEVQAKCSVDHFVELINRLKSLGIYDSALIILNADHGYWRVPDSRNAIQLDNTHHAVEADFQDVEDFAEKACASSPLLAIKLPHSRGPLRSSEAQTTNMDIPATIISLLNIGEKFDGKSVFDIDTNETRTRTFYYYDELPRKDGEYFNRLDEYSIRGITRDRNSWKFAGLILPPGASQSTTRLSFGATESATFIGFGWGETEVAPGEAGMKFRWAFGNSSSLYITLPKGKTKLTANVKSLMAPGKQFVKVKVDGKEVGGWTNTNFSMWDKHSIMVETDPNRPRVSTVVFEFSDYIKPGGGEYRELAMLFESLTIEEQN